MHRVVLVLDHASRRSGPQPLSSGFLFRNHPSLRSCSLGLLASRKYSSSSVLLRLLDVLVCLCLFACHALRDVIMAFHELIVRRCLAQVRSAEGLSVDTSVLRVSCFGLQDVSHRSSSSRDQHSFSSAATAASAMCLVVSGRRHTRFY